VTESLKFNMLRDTVQELIDWLFFRAHYDYRRVINKYSHALTRPMSDLNRLAHITPYLLTKSMQLSGAACLILDQESGNYLVRAGEREAKFLEGTTWPANSLLLQELVRQKKEISLLDVKGRLPEAKSSQLVNELQALKSALVIPSISDSEYFKTPTLIAVLCLGQKLSGKKFSADEISFLTTLANQATIAIEYAFIFEELKANQERVIRSEKLAAIGVTTAGVAHELKNPLTYVSTVAQVLPRKWDDPQFRESVNQTLPAEVQRMQLIVEGLLDYSRTKELALKPLDLTKVIDKTVALLAYEIKKYRINIKKEYQQTSEANGDQNRLLQVFMNLLTNAVQALGEKGGEIVINCRNSAGNIEVNIFDNGPGIAPENMTKIFDPFFTTKEAGTGLGLPICKKIIAEHHGTINVNSVLGKGTAVIVVIPLVSN